MSKFDTSFVALIKSFNIITGLFLPYKYSIVDTFMKPTNIALRIVLGASAAATHYCAVHWE